ncbi:MAG: hypothetical protein HOI66_15785 [Verrucomicrobia bacterium]|jgi:hypothetical protein|nr:hypothetical protein [Verrucomicrobiota bacterium]MDB4745772.1 hypothetical protein [Verrucomicrobiota bacterium]
MNATAKFKQNTPGRLIAIFCFGLIVSPFLHAASNDEPNQGQKSSNRILPNPNKVYSDQCYVWLKEMPTFFRERNYLPGGLAWDRHSYQGVYVSDNPSSLFYSRHYVGQTVVLFKPDTPGGNMNRENIIYQYSISQGNDNDLDQIWVHGEFMPPLDCIQWVLAATGKHRGIRSEGVWHWNWPENRNWQKPENPPGYDYPNAEEFNYQYPEASEGQPAMVGPEYWIDAPPFNVRETSLTLGLPATEKPTKTSRINEKGYILIKKLPELQQRQLIPPGNKGGPREEKTGFDHYNFEGVYHSLNPNSPFHNRPLTGKVMGVHVPKQGEGMNPSNVHCEYWCIQSGEPKGDQIWWWGELFSKKKAKFTLKVATGAFEGLSGVGTWHPEWPKDWNKPEIPNGYDKAIAHEYTFDMPLR